MPDSFRDQCECCNGIGSVPKSPDDVRTQAYSNVSKLAGMFEWCFDRKDWKWLDYIYTELDGAPMPELVTMMRGIQGDGEYALEMAASLQYVLKDARLRGEYKHE